MSLLAFGSETQLAWNCPVYGHLSVEIIIYLGNYNDLTATSLGIMVNKGNHPQMALIQVSEIL